MKILQRKIISASVSGTIFAILFTLIYTDPFRKSLSLFDVVSSIPVIMMYSIPVILIYGVTTSIISDKLAEFISINSGYAKAEIIISGVLHIVFGLVLVWISLGASVLFFVTDRLIRKQYKTKTWIEAIRSLAIPVLVWLIFVGIIWGDHLWFDS